MPEGWKITGFTDEWGYIFILDTSNKRRGVFRVKELPNKDNNGEVDFFFDILGLDRRIKSQNKPIFKIGNNDNLGNL